MNKRFCMFFCVTIASIAHAHEKAAPIDSELLHLIDGRLIGTVEIGQMLQNRAQTKEMQFGKKQGNSFVGLYTFKGTQHSVRTLAMLEAQYTKERNEAQKRLMDQGLTAAHELWKASEKKYTAQMDELRVCLKTAKNDFNKKSRPFIKHAQGTKGQMLDLISRCCKKHNRSDSLLLNWTKSKDGEEEESFNRDVTSFQIFDIFCADLIMFLEDMVRSCPKAYAQFMVEAKKEKIGTILSGLMQDANVRDVAFPALKEESLKYAFLRAHEKALLELSLNELTPGLIKEYLINVIVAEKKAVAQQALTKTNAMLEEIISEEQAKKITQQLEKDVRLEQVARSIANQDALADEKACAHAKEELRSLVQAALNKQ